LQESTGVGVLLAHLETALEVDPIHQQGRSLDEFLYSLRREAKEDLNVFTQRFRISLNRLRSFGIVLPEELVAFVYLKRLNLSSELRANVLTLSGGNYRLETLVKSAQTLMQHERAAAQSTNPRTRDTHHRQQVKQTQHKRRGWKPRAFKKTYHAQEDANPEDDQEDYDDQSQDHDQDGSEEYQYQEEDYEDEEEEDEEEEFQAFLAFKEARRGVQQARKGRGFKGTSKGKGKGDRSNDHRPNDRTSAPARGQCPLTACCGTGKVAHTPSL
jgi:hypothetical protein